MVVKGRPVGATLVGADAGEQIALWALALATRLKMSAHCRHGLALSDDGRAFQAGRGCLFLAATV